MRHSSIVALGALAIFAVVAGFSQADALQSVRASKDEVITVVITPSPAPVGFFHRAAPPATTAPRSPAPALFAQLLSDPFSPHLIASAGATWDVAPGAGAMLAQSSVQPPPVPVQFVAKPDPNSLYLKLIDHTPELDVPYGTTVFPCAFEVYTYYDKATYALNDYGSGTSKSGSGPYPVLNYPTISSLSWAAPDFSPTFVAYWNSGAPGEKVWTGALKQAQQHCIDLTIVVPNSQPAGTYTAVIQYNLLVN